jgi:hypothetical protein
MALVDTPVIMGAVTSGTSGTSVIGGVCIGVVCIGGAVSDFSRESESIANIAPPIIAAKHTSPMQTISRLPAFLMTTSVCRKLER